ncbi:MAG TPA: PIN domain-containing protein [Candidatus Acidoferrum sp.]|nr:PIN domain-containing protein [Candidatus Acidoferrum sp.]
MKPVLLDTGIIIALLNWRESSHKAAASAVVEIGGPLITCEAVITESCYLLRNVAGAAQTVLENVARGLFQIPFQLPREAPAVKWILRKYADRRIDFADACLIRLAEAFDTGDILTLDRDFETYRWGRNKPFNLLIDLAILRGHHN